MRVAVHTLGCKLNYAESSTVAREFARRGYEVVSHTEEADIYVVNTCSVTEHSDKKDRNLIRRLHRRSPEAIIAVIGCYAQLQGEYIASMEGVDIVLGAQSKGRVVDEVERLLSSGRRGKAAAEVTDIDSVQVIYPAFSTGERTRSFLKIQDGCDYKCSYCTVPYARLQVLLLHCPLCERMQPQSAVGHAGVPGGGDCRCRYQGDSAHWGQYR